MVKAVNSVSSATALVDAAQRAGALTIELPPELLARLTQESQRRTEQTMRQNLMYATQLQPVENFQP